MNKNCLGPFKLWTIENFPFIEADFDAITNYQLYSKIVEFVKMIAENQDILDNKIKYVIDYFENLDVQEEVNNKLDEMVEDGTLTTLITPYIDTLTAAAQQATSAANQATSAANQATTNVNNLTNQVGTIVEKLRNKLSTQYEYVNLPETMNAWFKNVQILKAIDKNNYNYALNIEKLKNSGGSTIYVDCNNANTGDGTEANPYNNFKTALTNSNNNDTIIVKKGLYYRQNLNNTSSQDWKNVNVICDEGTLFTTGEALTWTQNSTYNNVYQSNRTNVANVIDLRNWERGILSQLEKKSTLQACSQKVGSYYTDNTIIYVNLGEPVNNNNILCSIKLGYRPFNMIASSQNLHLYFKNATFIAGRDGIIRVSRSDSYTMEFIAENCKFLFSPVTSIDGVEFLGSKSILINCEASYNGKDGFNYHAQESNPCYAIELNCTGQANGLIDTDNHSYNGSTVHDGGQIVRVNCNYFDNNGGNITDIDSNTISVNYGCNCFDSQAETENEFSSDFCCKYGNCKMYLYNCFAQGKSYYNIYADLTTNNVYVDNCKYITTGGNGNINIL